MEINATKKVTVNAKTLSLHLKVRDGFTASLKDQDGQEITNYEGYVPDFMPGQHYGDYVILDIDINTGQITNWEQPTAKQLQDFIKENQEEEED